MDVFEGKNKRYRKQLIKFRETKFYEVSLGRGAMFVVSFANYKSRALSHDPSGDCVIPRAEVRVRAQASYGNITVLSHLNFKYSCFSAISTLTERENKQRLQT